MKYCTNIILVMSTATIWSQGIQHNLVCIFRSYILFSMIFRSPRHFWEFYLNRRKNKNKSRHWAGPQPLASWASGLCYHWGLTAERTGLPSLDQRPSRPASPRRRCAAHARPARGHRGHTRRGGVGTGGSSDVEVGRGAQGRTGGVRPTRRQGG
jgi:hypothetical protein